jgi:NitT/TauT family transport system permease protein
MPMKRLLNRQPDRAGKIALGLLPLVLLVLAYWLASDARLAENPNDKLMPAFGSFVDAIERLAFEPNKRSGEYLFWNDTAASLKRIALGVSLSALIGLVFGIVIGLLPLVRAGLSPLVTVLSLIPPMAILPILFIVFGLGELSKVMLIVIGITPFIIRDLQGRVMEIPQEILIKAQTLGANTWQIVVRVVLPQVLPRLLDAVRLSLGSAWLFLIAAEAIAATEGLGYRIFLVRRYMSMDIILPYVAWIAVLAFAMDWSLKTLSRWLFPWYFGIAAKDKAPADNTTGMAEKAA